MLKNYLKIALRNLVKQRLYTFVNIFGLAIGLACVVLILRYVQYELSFDTFHEKADRIYRVVQRQPGNVFLGTDHFAVTPAPLARTLVSEFPEVTHATTINPSSALLTRGEEHFYEEGLWADEHVFEVFTFPMIQGQAETALAEPNTIVLTASLAEKIFGDEDPLGKTLIHQNAETFTVTGVIEDVPANAHFTFSFIASIHAQSNYVRNLDRWDNNSWFTYFVLQEGASPYALQAKMPAFAEKYLADDEDDLDELNHYYLQSLRSIHLHSHVNFEMAANNDVKYVYLFTAIALVILLIACVNYMNLATARSITRAREVGMRKVVGAHRWQLIRQFIGESMLLAFLAMGLALALVYLLLPSFSRLVERDLAYVGSGRFMVGLLGIALVVGFIAGSYPALFMSALRPVHVLKGTLAQGTRRSRLPRLLVVGQYAISVVLIVGSLCIYQQLRYIQNKEIGYNREHVVVMRIRDRAMRENHETLQNELQRQPNVVAVTFASHLPTRIGSSTVVRGWEGSSPDDELQIYQASVDYDYLDVFELGLVAGRNFSRDFPSDTVAAFLLNETAVKAMGWDSAVGKEFHYGSSTVGPVVGVLKDFHMHSLHQPIQPLMMQLDFDWVSYVAVKIRPENIPGTLAFLEETMGKFTPYPFEYEFLDETFDQLYKTEIKLGEALGYFTLLALLIASLGLFGLAAFTAERRTKEIGVRKVLGASIPGIVLLLSREFTTLVAAAFVLAVPVAYVAMNRWLEDFAYRIDLSWWIFVVAGLAALVMAWLSVGYQAVKAARVNPVASLRYE